MDDPYGLFMYDHLGKRTSLPDPPGCVLAQNRYLKPEIVRGFEYSDCWVDDALPGAGQRADGRPQRRRSAYLHPRYLGETRMACGWWKRKILIAVRSLLWKARGLAQCHRPMGQTVLRRRDASALALRHPFDQGQPHRGAAGAYPETGLYSAERR